MKSWKRKGKRLGGYGSAGRFLRLSQRQSTSSGSYSFGMVGISQKGLAKREIKGFPNFILFHFNNLIICFRENEEENMKNLIKVPLLSSPLSV